MAFASLNIYGRRRGNWEESRKYTRFSVSAENEQADAGRDVPQWEGCMAFLLL